MVNAQKQIILTLACFFINLFWVSSVISGTIVFDEEVSGESIIYIISPDGTNLREIGKGLLPQWSPDGKLISYVQYSDKVDISNVKGLAIIDTSGKKVTELSLKNIWTSIVRHSWRPDSKAISLVTAVARHDGVLSVFDLTTMQVKNLKNIYFNDLDEAFVKTTIEWTPDGKQILFSTGSLSQIEGSGFELIDVGTKNIRKLSDKGMSPMIVGNKIVFIIGSEIWSMNLDGSDRKKLFDVGMLIYASSNIADNTMILQLNANRNEGIPLMKLYRLNLKDLKFKEIKDDQYSLYCPKISRDGKKFTAIGLKVNKETGHEEDVGYYVYDLGTGKITLLKRFEEKREPEQFGMQILLGVANHSSWN